MIDVTAQLEVMETDGLNMEEESNSSLKAPTTEKVTAKEAAAPPYQGVCLA